ncbi:MAG: hypothetical protein ACHQ4F_00500 [Candidatus Dormibacteria bacterium]
MQIRRVLVKLLVGTSLFSVLFASTDLSAAGIRAASNGRNATLSASQDKRGDSDRDCKDRRADDRDGDRDEERSHGRDGDDRRCVPSPSAPAAPATLAPSPPARPQVSPGAAPHAKGSSTPAKLTTPAPPPGEEPAAGPRPPVLAPAALTIPPAGRPVSAPETLPGGLYTVALSSMLVAASIAVVSLVLVRRSD